MTLEIRYFEAALAELEAAVVWCRDHRPAHVADRLLREVSDAVLELAELPRACPVSPLDPRVRVRILRRIRYAIFYQLSDAALFVAAIAHTSRRPGYWLDRLR